MARATKVICPHCHTALKSAQGVQVGQKITCPKCAASFTVPADEDRSSAAKQQGRVHAGRLLLVLFAALLYLLGGGALAYYCFDRSFRKLAPADAWPVAQEDVPEEGAAGPSAPPQPVRRPTVTVDAMEQRKIDDAIVKGVWFLKGKHLPDGTWGDTGPGGTPNLSVGYAALVALTLLECGVPAADEQITQAAEHVRQQAPGVGLLNFGTYQTTLAILFLDRLGAAKDKELIQYLALRLVAGQRPDDGGWGYWCPLVDRKATQKLLTQLRNDKQSLDQWRKAAAQKGSALKPDWRTDNSITQFAVLALWVARRHDVPIERTAAQVGERFRKSQAPSGPDPMGNNLNLDGSWFYEGSSNSSSWPSMTCAGLLGLAVANATAKNGPPPEDKSRIARALAMLAREIDRPGEKRPVDLYYLWSLERVGVLYDLPTIDGKDWYAWGRKVLLPQQAPNGRWRGGGPVAGPLSDTCFALLFLKQANLATDLTSKLQLLAEKK